MYFYFLVVSFFVVVFVKKNASIVKFHLKQENVVSSSRSMLVQAHLTKITSKSFLWGWQVCHTFMKPLGLRLSSCPGFSSQEWLKVVVVIY